MKKLICMILIFLNFSLNAKISLLPYKNYLKVNEINLANVLLNEADTWIGTKYVWGGTSRKGIDCSAFVRNVYEKSLNIYLPRTSREQFKYTKQIDKNNIQKGDLVFFLNSKGIHHVGIIYDKDKFIHASSSRGVRIDSLNSGYWKNKKKKFCKII
jgi:lipoprotein Spr